MSNETNMTPDTTGATGGEKFTPGPWSFITVVTSIGHCHKINPMNACIYVDHRGKDDRDEKTATALANARLMSAAPELYDLLKQAGHIISEISIQTSTVPHFYDFLSKVEAALAKANGGGGE